MILDDVCGPNSSFWVSSSSHHSDNPSSMIGMLFGFLGVHTSGSERLKVMYLMLHIVSNDSRLTPSTLLTILNFVPCFLFKRRGSIDTFRPKRSVSLLNINRRMGAHTVCSVWKSGIGILFPHSSFNEKHWRLCQMRNILFILSITTLQTAKTSLQLYKLKTNIISLFSSLVLCGDFSDPRLIEKELSIKEKRRLYSVIVIS